MKMKYEFQVRMQQRHLKAIVGALRFRQRFLAGDVYGTIGRAAMDAWGTLPEVAHGAYPARKGEKGAGTTARGLRIEQDFFTISILPSNTRRGTGAIALCILWCQACH